jgi:predicted metal-binding protein
MRLVRSNWRTALLICRKCSKRQHGGFGPKGKTPLAKALKKELGGKKGRKAPVGIVEVKCLGVCPRHAVTMVDARRPRDWLLVKPGTPVGEIMEAVGLEEEDPLVAHS